MERRRSNRIKRFTAGLFLLAVPAIFIASINTLTAQATKNASSGQFSVDQSQLERDQHVIEFSLTGSSINEGGGMANINVEIDPPIVTASVEIYVQYLTVNGTASAPGDFVAESGVLTVTSSSSGGIESISIEINDDIIDEPNETFSVILRNRSEKGKPNIGRACHHCHKHQEHCQPNANGLESFGPCVAHGR
jgi:hypothetical protein